MNFEIRPVITEHGVKYRAVKPGGWLSVDKAICRELGLVDKAICRELGTDQFSLGDPDKRFSVKAEYLFDAPEDAANKIKEMFGTTATIRRYRL